MPTLSRLSRWGFCFLAGTALLLPACSSDGHFTLLGYTTAPNYDCSIRTVYVPIFQNKTMWRGIEFDFHRAVVREIEAKTPFKMVDSPVGADTELLCTIINQRKAPINLNQIGEVREAEITVAVEVIWRDLRPGHTGDVLSGMGRKGADPMGGLAAPGGQRPNRASSPPGAQPVLITPTATFIPELGGSRTSAEAIIGQKLATQIVSMMEVWKQP